MTKTYSKKNQNGRSMIEMLGVLAIVGVLSAGGIAGYNMAMESHKTNQLINKIQLMQTQARALFKYNNYTGITANALIQAGKITDNNNPFTGLYFDTINMGKNDDNGFFIHFWAPKDACVEVLTTYWGPQATFVAASIKNGTTTVSSFGYSSGTYPPDTAAAISACNGGNKDMYLWFR